MAITQAKARSQSYVCPRNDGRLHPPDWSALAGRPEALAFGEQLWSEALQRARPELVIAMVARARHPLDKVLEIEALEAVPVPCGRGRLLAHRVRDRGVTFIALLHPSRYRIIGRDDSASALQALFGERWLSS